MKRDTRISAFASMIQQVFTHCACLLACFVLLNMPRLHAGVAQKERPQGWNDFPVGYHLISLPQGTIVSGWNMYYWGMGFQMEVQSPFDPGDINTKTALRIEEIKSLKTGDGSSLFMKDIALRTGDGKAIFYWDDEERNQLICESFQCKDGLLFRSMRTSPSSPEGQARTCKELVSMLDRLHGRDPWAVPSAPGFCLDHAFLAGLPDQKFLNGRLAVEFRLPGSPGAQLCLFNQVNGDRIPEPMKSRTLSPLESRLRGGKRMARITPGVEDLLAVKANGKAFQYYFAWEATGSPHCLEKPRLCLHFIAGSEAYPTTLTNVEAIRLWDNILAGIRIRPTVPAMHTPPGARVLKPIDDPKSRLKPLHQCVCVEQAKMRIVGRDGNPMTGSRYRTVDGDDNLVGEGVTDADGWTSGYSEFPGPVEIQVWPKQEDAPTPEADPNQKKPK